MFVCFAASVQGESHKKNHNKPCEDASGVFEAEVTHNGNKCQTALAVVADGHGGDKYFRSRFGSKIAVETAHEEIEKFIAETAEGGKGFFDPDAQTDMDKKAGHKRNLVILEKRIIRAWQQKVAEHIQSEPLTQKEFDFCTEKGIALSNDSAESTMYGTTLIAVLVTDFFWFALQIGDGACVIIKQDGKAELGVADDSDQGFGTTHSLCNTDAADHFRRNFQFETLLGATAASDGVTDSYPTEKYLEFTVTNLLKNLIEEPEHSKEELETNFLPMLSQKGSQDDVSLACAFNADAAKPVLSSIVEKAKNALEVKALSKERDQIKAERDQIQQELDQCQQEVGTWKNRYTKENAERIRIEGNLKALGAELKTAQQKVTELSEKIVPLENQCRQEKTGRERAENDLQTTKRNLGVWKDKYYKEESLYNQEKIERANAERDREHHQKQSVLCRNLYNQLQTLCEKETGKKVEIIRGPVGVSIRFSKPASAAEEEEKTAEEEEKAEKEEKSESLNKSVTDPGEAYIYPSKPVPNDNRE